MPPPSKKIAVDSSGVARKFKSDGNKGQRHFLVGDMGAHGGG